MADDLLKLAQEQVSKHAVAGTLAKLGLKGLGRVGGFLGRKATEFAVKNPMTTLGAGLTVAEVAHGASRGLSANRVSGQNPFMPTMPMPKMGAHDMDSIDQMVAEGLLTEKQANDARQRGEELAKEALALDPTAGMQYFEELSKEALDFSGLKNLSVDLSPVLGALALSAGGALVDRVSNAIFEPRRMAQGYKSMIEANPGLQRHDATKLQRAYHSLHTLNPQFAYDPAIAGTFVSRVLNMTTDEDEVPVAIDMPMANTIAGAGKSLSDARRGSGGNMVSNALRAAGPSAVFSMADPEAAAARNEKLRQQREMHQAMMMREQAEMERADRSGWGQDPQQQLALAQQLQQQRGGAQGGNP